MDKTIGEHVEEMKALAEMLVPHSFPMKSMDDDDDVAVLKQRHVRIDGYDLVVFFSKCSDDDSFLETLEVYGRDFCFLPLTVVCKCARLFLGDDDLSLMEFMQHNHPNLLDEHSRNVYVWTVHYDLDGISTETPVEGEKVCHDGLRFLQIK